MNKLTFGQGNSKLDRFTDTFSLPAGFTCPGALQCKSVCNPKTGKIQDSPGCEFRCAMAFSEALYASVRNARWYNFNSLKSCKTTKQISNLIGNSLPSKPIKVRPGTSGDFYNQSYFDAWMNVAKEFPNTIFYAYTKSIPFWLNRLGTIPKNFRLVASIGGKWDRLVFLHNLKRAVVVYSPEEAEKLKLEIDHDDSHAYDGTKNFALLLHSMQPAGTEAGKAYTELKKRGIAGYQKHKAGRIALSQ